MQPTSTDSFAQLRRVQFYKSNTEMLCVSLSSLCESIAMGSDNYLGIFETSMALGLFIKIVYRYINSGDCGDVIVLCFRAISLVLEHTPGACETAANRHTTITNMVGVCVHKALQGGWTFVQSDVNTLYEECLRTMRFVYQDDATGKINTLTFTADLIALCSSSCDYVARQAFDTLAILCANITLPPDDHVATSRRSFLSLMKNIATFGLARKSEKSKKSTYAPCRNIACDDDDEDEEEEQAENEEERKMEGRGRDDAGGDDKDLSHDNSSTTTTTTTTRSSSALSQSSNKLVRSVEKVCAPFLLSVIEQQHHLLEAATPETGPTTLPRALRCLILLVERALLCQRRSTACALMPVSLFDTLLRIIHTLESSHAQAADVCAERVLCCTTLLALGAQCRPAAMRRCLLSGDGQHFVHRVLDAAHSVVTTLSPDPFAHEDRHSGGVRVGFMHSSSATTAAAAAAASSSAAGTAAHAPGGAAGRTAVHSRDTMFIVAALRVVLMACRDVRPLLHRVWHEAAVVVRTNNDNNSDNETNNNVNNNKKEIHEPGMLRTTDEGGGGGSNAHRRRSKRSSFLSSLFSSSTADCSSGPRGERRRSGLPRSTILPIHRWFVEDEQRQATELKPALCIALERVWQRQEKVCTLKDLSCSDVVNLHAMKVMGSTWVAHKTVHRDSIPFEFRLVEERDEECEEAAAATSCRRGRRVVRSSSSASSSSSVYNGTVPVACLSAGESASRADGAATAAALWRVERCRRCRDVREGVMREKQAELHCTAGRKGRGEKDSNHHSGYNNSSNNRQPCGMGGGAIRSGTRMTEMEKDELKDEGDDAATGGRDSCVGHVECGGGRTPHADVVPCQTSLHVHNNTSHSCPPLHMQQHQYHQKEEEKVTVMRGNCAHELLLAEQYMHKVCLCVTHASGKLIRACAMRVCVTMLYGVLRHYAATAAQLALLHRIAMPLCEAVRESTATESSDTESGWWSLVAMVWVLGMTEGGVRERVCRATARCGLLHQLERMCVGGDEREAAPLTDTAASWLPVSSSSSSFFPMRPPDGCAVSSGSGGMGGSDGSRAWTEGDEAAQGHWESDAYAPQRTASAADPPLPRFTVPAPWASMSHTPPPATNTTRASESRSDGVNVTTTVKTTTAVTRMNHSPHCRDARLSRYYPARRMRLVARALCAAIHRTLAATAVPRGPFACPPDTTTTMPRLHLTHVWPAEMHTWTACESTLMSGPPSFPWGQATHSMYYGPSASSLHSSTLSRPQTGVAAMRLAFPANSNAANDTGVRERCGEPETQRHVANTAAVTCAQPASVSSLLSSHTWRPPHASSALQPLSPSRLCVRSPHLIENMNSDHTNTNTPSLIFTSASASSHVPTENYARSTRHPPPPLYAGTLIEQEDTMHTLTPPPSCTLDAPSQMPAWSHAVHFAHMPCNGQSEAHVPREHDSGPRRGYLMPETARLQAVTSTLFRVAGQPGLHESVLQELFEALLAAEDVTPFELYHMNLAGVLVRYLMPPTPTSTSASASAQVAATAAEESSCDASDLCAHAARFDWTAPMAYGTPLTVMLRRRTSEPRMCALLTFSERYPFAMRRLVRHIVSTLTQHAALPLVESTMTDEEVECRPVREAFVAMTAIAPKVALCRGGPHEGGLSSSSCDCSSAPHHTAAATDAVAHAVHEDHTEEGRAERVEVSREQEDGHGSSNNTSADGATSTWPDAHPSSQPSHSHRHSRPANHDPHTPRESYMESVHRTSSRHRHRHSAAHGRSDSDTSRTRSVGPLGGLFDCFTIPSMYHVRGRGERGRSAAHSYTRRDVSFTRMNASPLMLLGEGGRATSWNRVSRGRHADEDDEDHVVVAAAAATAAGARTATRTANSHHHAASAVGAQESTAGAAAREERNAHLLLSMGDVERWFRTGVTSTKLTQHAPTSPSGLTSVLPFYLRTVYFLLGLAGEFDCAGAAVTQRGRVAQQLLRHPRLLERLVREQLLSFLGHNTSRSAVWLRRGVTNSTASLAVVTTVSAMVNMLPAAPESRGGSFGDAATMCTGVSNNTTETTRTTNANKSGGHNKMQGTKKKGDDGRAGGKGGLAQTRISSRRQPPSRAATSPGTGKPSSGTNLHDATSAARRASPCTRAPPNHTHTPNAPSSTAAHVSSPSAAAEETWPSMKGSEMKKAKELIRHALEERYTLHHPVVGVCAMQETLFSVIYRHAFAHGHEAIVWQLENCLMQRRGTSESMAPHTATAASRPAVNLVTSSEQSRTAQSTILPTRAHTAHTNTANTAQEEGRLTKQQKNKGGAVGRADPMHTEWNVSRVDRTADEVRIPCQMSRTSAARRLVSPTEGTDTTTHPTSLASAPDNHSCLPAEHHRRRQSHTHTGEVRNASPPSPVVVVAAGNKSVPVMRRRPPHRRTHADETCHMGNNDHYNADEWGPYAPAAGSGRRRLALLGHRSVRSTGCGYGSFFRQLGELFCRGGSVSTRSSGMVGSPHRRDSPTHPVMRGLGGGEVGSSRESIAEPPTLWLSRASTIVFHHFLREEASRCVCARYTRAEMEMCGGGGGMGERAGAPSSAAPPIQPHTSPARFGAGMTLKLPEVAHRGDMILLLLLHDALERHGALEEKDDVDETASQKEEEEEEACQRVRKSTTELPVHMHMGAKDHWQDGRRRATDAGRCRRVDFLNLSLAAKVTQSAEASALRVSVLPPQFALPRWVNFVLVHAHFLIPFSARYPLARYLAGEARRALIQHMRTTQLHRRLLHRRDDVLLQAAEWARRSNHKFTLRRSALGQEAYTVLRKCADARLPVSMEFRGDAGVGQGPTAQFYTLVAKELCRPSRGLWGHTATVMKPVRQKLPPPYAHGSMNATATTCSPAPESRSHAAHTLLPTTQEDGTHDSTPHTTTTTRDGLPHAPGGRPVPTTTAAAALSNKATGTSSEKKRPSGTTVGRVMTSSTPITSTATPHGGLTQPISSWQTPHMTGRGMRNNSNSNNNNNNNNESITAVSTVRADATPLHRLAERRTKRRTTTRTITHTDNDDNSCNAPPAQHTVSEASPSSWTSPDIVPSQSVLESPTSTTETPTPIQTPPQTPPQSIPMPEERWDDGTWNCRTTRWERAEGVVQAGPEGLYPRLAHEAVRYTHTGALEVSLPRSSAASTAHTGAVRRAWLMQQWRDRERAFYMLGAALGRAFVDGQVLPLSLCPVLVTFLRRGTPYGLCEPPSRTRNRHTPNVHGTTPSQQVTCDEEPGTTTMLDMLGLELSHLRDVDAALWRGLRALMQLADSSSSSSSSPHEEDDTALADLSISFTLPGVGEYELCAGGKDRVLQNTKELPLYLRAVAQAMLYDAVALPRRALAMGWADVVPREAVHVLRPRELLAVLCGEGGATAGRPLWTHAEMQSVLVGDHGYHKDSPELAMLAHVLAHRFTPAEQRLFLMFCTGCPRLPVGGVRALGCITVVRRSDALPHSAAVSYALAVNAATAHESEEEEEEEEEETAAGAGAMRTGLASRHDGASVESSSSPPETDGGAAAASLGFAMTLLSEEGQEHGTDESSHRTSTDSSSSSTTNRRAVGSCLGTTTEATHEEEESADDVCVRSGRGGVAPRTDDARREGGRGGTGRGGSCDTEERPTDVLHWSETEWALPTVNTCFRYIKLPPYPTEELMYKKLLQSVMLSGDTFELS